MDIVNNVLRKTRLGEVETLSEPKLFTYPYNCIEPLISESINTFSSCQLWDSSETVTNLEFFSGFESYHLSDFDIDFNRVKEVFYFDSSEKISLNRIPHKEFKRLYSGSSVYGKPLVYGIKNDTIEFYPKISQDYGLKILHYKHIPVLNVEIDEVEMIPETSQNPIWEFVSAVMSVILFKSNSVASFKEHLRDIGKVKKENQTYFSRKNIMPSSIRW